MNSGVTSEEGPNEFVSRTTRAMAAGSESAYREFYDVWFDRLYRHLLFRSQGNEELARELAQLVLLRVIRYIQPFDCEQKFWAWLRQIARSCHIDHLRKLGRAPEFGAVEIMDEALPATVPETEDAEMMLALDRSLGELDSDELVILQRIYFDDLSQEELAAQLSTTRKAVESRLARIRKKLRSMVLEKLKDYALL